MNFNSKINQSLFERQLNLKQNFNSNYYKNQIVDAYFNENDVMYKSDLNYHDSVVSTLKFSNDDKYLASGSMDGCIAVWNIDDLLNFPTKPNIMKDVNETIVYTLTFNTDTSKIFSGTSDKNLYVHDPLTCENTNTIVLDSKIDDMSSNPFNPNVISMGCENGSLCLYDARKSNYNFIRNLFSLEKFYTIQYHPLNENILLLASGEGNGFFSFDLRNNEPYSFYYFLFSNNLGTYCAKYNKTGDKIIALRQKYCPVLFKANNPFPVLEFDEYGLFNSFEFKECCFAGPNDEYVVSGSDDFNLFIWEIPQEYTSFEWGHEMIKKVNKAKFKLKGHRSTISHVSYNYQRSILASSAIETSIKFWSPFHFESNIDKNNLSNKSDHDRILNLDYLSTSLFDSKNSFVFDNSIEYSNIMSAIDDIIKYRFFDPDLSNECKFNFSHKIYNLHTPYPLLHFQDDINIYFIKSLIVNMMCGDVFKPKLFEVMEELNSNKENTKSINLKIMSFLFEGRKYFTTWNLIGYSITYLLKQMVAIKNSIDQIDKLKTDDAKLVKKKDELFKVLLVINLMNCYLLKTYLENRHQFSTLLKTMQSVLSNLYNSSFKFIFKPQVSKDITKFFTKFEFGFEPIPSNQNIDADIFMGNNYLDEDLELSSSKLKKKFIQQYEIIKELKNIKYPEPIIDFYYLLEIFCLLNLWLVEDESVCVDGKRNFL